MMPATMPTLETERLILRAFQLEDASEFERLIAPKEVTDGTLSFPHPVPEGWGIERINRMFGCAIHISISINFFSGNRTNIYNMTFFIFNHYIRNSMCDIK